MDNTIKNEICYREELNEKMQRKTLTENELMWLKTHREYSPFKGYPYLFADIISMRPNSLYSVHVENHSQYDCQIIPTFSVSYGKGSIIAHSPVIDFKGKKAYKKPIRMLSLLFEETDASEFTFSAELGLMTIKYGCFVYDENQKTTIYRSTDARYGDCAMLCKKTENKYIYRCKLPGKEIIEPQSFSVKIAEIQNDM